MVEFDVIPYRDIVWGRKLGSGSFGSVYKGTYLGIDIAIKEILASTEYDVHKYFEREWRIMRECRHPNIVLFLGLSQEAGGDGKVYIVSEYVPGGNLRQYILSSRPFPWRLRLSFATDVARAVAYLHARKCIHRDLKGENLLLTSNERVKVTDFGFARIASRSAEEMKRMTYCGTDGYMSPEIINGQDFDLPTDVFSLGIIFLEILSRKLVDQHTFIRVAPSFTPDPEEIHRRASHGCPKAFIDLALDCCEELPSKRPVMPEVLKRLRDIELEILGRTDDPTGAEHVGSVKLLRHTGPRAMPLFTPLTPVIPTTGVNEGTDTVTEADSEQEEEEAKMEQDALRTLAGLDVEGGGAAGAPSTYGTCRAATWDEGNVVGQTAEEATRQAELEAAMASQVHSAAGLPTSESLAGPSVAGASVPGDTSEEIDLGGDSTMTIKGTVLPPTSEPETKVETPSTTSSVVSEPPGSWPGTIGTIPSLTSHMGKLLTKHQRGEKAEKEDLERIRKIAAGTHRFTLVDKDAVPLVNGKKISSFSALGFLQKGLTASVRCPVCQKRLGQRPALRCDDCEISVHVKCSHATQRNCTG